MIIASREPERVRRRYETLGAQVSGTLNERSAITVVDDGDWPLARSPDHTEVVGLRISTRSLADLDRQLERSSALQLPSSTFDTTCAGRSVHAVRVADTLLLFEPSAS